jgi:Icc-related predicted phosphoesterase
MTRIAYVTDLHFGGPQTKTRLESLKAKMAKLPPDTRAVCLTGDIFTLTGSPAWQPMIAGPLLLAEITERSDFSRQLVTEWAPQLADAIPNELPILMIPGNADRLAYEHMVTLPFQAKERFNYLDGRAMKGMTLNFLGAGTITPDNPNAENILKHNPWYSGIVTLSSFGQVLNRLLAATNSWQNEDWAKAILLTHMPACGHVDRFDGKAQGSLAVLNFIHFTRPLLHLAGHVHSGPFGEEGYRPWSVIDGLTVSLNAGGDFRHDGEPGVKALLIDVAALATLREHRKLDGAAVEQAIISL